MAAKVLIRKEDWKVQVKVSSWKREFQNEFRFLHLTWDICSTNFEFAFVEKI